MEKQFNEFYSVILHNTSSLESQVIFETDIKQKAEDVYCNILKVIGTDMEVSIDTVVEENHEYNDVF